MKRIILTLSLIALLPVLILAQKTKITDPVEYNNLIVMEQNEIMVKNLRYIKASAHGRSDRKIEKRRKEVVAQIEESIKNLEKIKTMENDGGFKKDAVASLNLSLKAFKVDYLYANEMEERSEQSFEIMEEYLGNLDKAEAKLKEAGEKTMAAQRAFAELHDIQIQENENPLNEQLKNVSEVNKYQRQVFLAYFRASKANNDFFEALNSGKTTGLEFKRKECLEACEAALETLTNMPGFRGNKSFKISAENLVKFYKDLAENGFKSMVEYHKKEQRDITQKDVDAYNKVINDYNTKIPILTDKYNQMQARYYETFIPAE